MNTSIVWSTALSVLVALLLFATTGKPCISIGGGDYYSYGGNDE
jgi:hypothetical protein